MTKKQNSREAQKYETNPKRVMTTTMNKTQGKTGVMRKLQTPGNDNGQIYNTTTREQEQITKYKLNMNVWET